MKANIRVVADLRIQEPLALREINHLPVLVLRNIILFEPGKIIQLFLILSGEPAGFEKGQIIELHGGGIFMQETVLNDFKLQFSHTADNFLISAELGE